MTRAELIRRGIDRILREDEGEDPLLSLIGQAGSELDDGLSGSEDHDRILYGENEEIALPVAREKPPPRRRR
jgi:hypothetical protein